MRQRPFASVLSMLVVVVLIAGCAGPTVGSAVVTPAAFDEHLVGTWNGVFWVLSNDYYADDGTLLLQIKEDGTFTVTMTPAAASNNLAKATSWSGTISQRGKVVVFHLSKGQWPAWSSLSRSGDTLYGVANEPWNGFDIGIKLERADGGALAERKS